MFLNSKKCVILAFLVFGLLLTQTAAFKCWNNLCNPSSSGCTPYNETLPERTLKECKDETTNCLTWTGPDERGKFKHTKYICGIGDLQAGEPLCKVEKEVRPGFDAHYCYCTNGEGCNNAECCNCDGAGGCSSGGSGSDGASEASSIVSSSIGLWKVAGIGSFLMTTVCLWDRLAK